MGLSGGRPNEQRKEEDTRRGRMGTKNMTMIAKGILDTGKECYCRGDDEGDDDFAIAAKSSPRDRQS